MRRRRVETESEKRETIVADNDDDFVDDYEEKEEPGALGDDMYGKLVSDADRAAAAGAVPRSSLSGGEVPSVPFADGGIDDLFVDNESDDF